MSIPSDPQGNYNVTMSYYKGEEANPNGNQLQSSITSIYAGQSKAITTNFSTADDTSTGYFTQSNLWSCDSMKNSTFSSNGINTMLFFYTFSITDKLYSQLASGQVTASLTGNLNSWTDNNDGTGDFFLSLYLGLGYSSSDARYLHNYTSITDKVTNGQSNSNGQYSLTTNSSTTYTPTEFSNHTFSTSTTNNYSKYLRIGLYVRLWNNNNQSAHVRLNNLTLTLSQIPGTMSVPTNGNTNAGVPYRWQTTHLSGSESNGGNYTQSTSNIPTINSTTYIKSDITSGFTTVDSVPYIYSEKFSSSITDGQFDADNNWTFDADAGDYLYHVGMMYTFRLDTDVYNAIITGNVRISLTSSVSHGITTSGGGTYAGDVDVWAYLGIGGASSDAEAVTFDGFIEQSAFISNKVNKADGASVIQSNMTGLDSKTFSLSASTQTYKYLRIGVWGECWPGYQGSEMTLKAPSFTLTLQKPITPGRLMSNPGDVYSDNNDYYLTSCNAGANGTGVNKGFNSNETYYEQKRQNSIVTIDSISGGYGDYYTTSYESSNSYDTLTLVSDNGNYFQNSSGDATWNRTTTGQSMDNLMFIRTFKLSTNAYNTLISNHTINILVYGSASRGSTATNGGDTDMWLYLGIGTAESDEEALSYEGFKETSCIISQKTHQAGNSSGSTYANATLTNINARYPITTGLKNTATQKITEVPGSGTKYLRIAMFAEVWAEKAAQQLVDTIYMQLSFITNTDSDVGTMTVPDDSTSSGTTVPKGWSSASTTIYGGTDGNGYFLQNSVPQISAGTTSSTYSVGANGDYTCVSDYSGGGFSNQGSYLAFGQELNGGTYHLGFMYTYRLTEETYNALISGKIKATVYCTSKGGTSNRIYGACVQQWLYLGLGYASSDYNAATYRGFVQMHGAIGPQGRQSDNTNNYGDLSLTSSGEYIDGFDFSQNSIVSSTYVTKMNKSVVSNGYTKYLRIGVWAQPYGYSDATVWYEQVAMTLTLTPVSADTTAPSISGITNGYTDSDTVVISDSTGIDYYTLNGTQVDVADYRNTFNPTQVGVILPSQGQYTLEAKDLFNNTITSVNFVYFKPTVVVQGSTNGELGNYDGGGIVFDSSASYSYDTISKSYAVNATVNITAHPNDGYYFAGFTEDTSILKNLNLDLQSSAISSGTNGRYATIDGDGLVFTYQFVIKDWAIVPSDGVINLVAHFTDVPFEEQSKTYTGSPQEATSIGAVENVAGTNNISASVVTYDDLDAIDYMPKNVGTYEALCVVTWNDVEVGSITKTFTITPRAITPTFQVLENTKIYDATTSWDSSKVSYTFTDAHVDDVSYLSLSYDTVLSDKNVGLVDVIISNLVFSGTERDGFNISNNYTITISEATLSQVVTITKKPVSITFKAQDKFYDGTNEATVTFVIDGLVGGESIDFEAYTATFEDAKVGKNKVVTLSPNPPQPIAGNAETDLNNYTITLINLDSLIARINNVLGAVSGENHIHITQVTEELTPYCDAVYEVSTTKTGYELVGLYAIYETGELAINDYYGNPLKLALTKVEDMDNGNTRWVIYGISGKCYLYGEWKAGTVAVTWNVASGLTLSSRPTVYVEKGLTPAEMPYATGSGNTYFSSISVTYSEWNSDFTTLSTGLTSPSGYIPSSAVQATVTYNASTFASGYRVTGSGSQSFTSNTSNVIYCKPPASSSEQTNIYNHTKWSDLVKGYVGQGAGSGGGNTNNYSGGGAGIGFSWDFNGGSSGSDTKFFLYIPYYFDGALKRNALAGYSISVSASAIVTVASHTENSMTNWTKGATGAWLDVINGPQTSATIYINNYKNYQSGYVGASASANYSIECLE